MPIQEYTDENGFRYVVEVPPGTDPAQYKRGIRLGPPDLSSLKLSQDVLRELHNGLVEKRLLYAPDIEKPGRMQEVLALLQAVTKNAKDQQVRDLLRSLVSLYQQEYYI
jgi:hypothetical protein